MAMERDGQCRLRRQSATRQTRAGSIRDAGNGAATKKGSRRSPLILWRWRPRLVRVGPDLALDEVQQARQHYQEQEHLHAEPLAGVKVRLRGPHQERGDVP